MLKKILIILLISVFISTSSAQVFTPTFEEKILKGRIAFDRYRDGLNIDDHNIIFGYLIKELHNLGYSYESSLNPIEDFKDDNRLYNIRQLGYDNINDFQNNGNISQAYVLIEMWR